MHRTARALLSCVLLFAAFAGLVLSQQPKTNTIGGVVLRSSTNEPLPGVSVQLQPSGRSEAYEVQTANDGRFQFRNIPAGDYTLAAVRSGFVRSDYGRRRTSDPPFILTVGSNRTIDSIELHMVPSGAVFGRVTNGEGEPVAAAIVRAWLETFVDGQRAVRLITTVSTDDLGNYRLFSLAPGKYYVSTVLRTGANNAPSFYPDTTDIRAAGLITLSAGSMAGGINITYRAESGRTVRGTVSFSGTEASVQLTPRIPIVSERSNLAVPVDPRTGGFSTPQIAPGAYILTAISDNVSTETAIDVGNAAVVDVRVAIPSPIEIAAHVSLDPTAASNRIDLSSVMFGIRRDTDVPDLPNATYTPGIENTFTIRLAPGDYRMRTVMTPPNAYIQSIRLGNVDVLNDGLHLDSSVRTPLEIVIAADTGALDGVVANAQRRSEPNVVVVLIPAAPRRQRVDLIQNVRTDDEGRFKFEHVPPGDYSVYSWEDVEPTAWMNANFMKEYESLGKPVHVDAGGRQTVLVEAIASGN